MGITEEDFEQQLACQDGLCASCDQPGTHADHDHLTGRFRGILCGACNTALGFAKDSPRTLRRLALYLERAH